MGMMKKAELKKANLFAAAGSNKTNEEKMLEALGKEAAELVSRIDDMLEDEDTYGWAEETLTGIRSTVLRTGEVSFGQQRAIENIESAGMRRRRGL